MDYDPEETVAVASAAFGGSYSADSERLHSFDDMTRQGNDLPSKRIVPVLDAPALMIVGIQPPLVYRLLPLKCSKASSSSMAMVLETAGYPLFCDLQARNWRSDIFSGIVQRSREGLYINTC